MLSYTALVVIVVTILPLHICHGALTFAAPSYDMSFTAQCVVASKVYTKELPARANISTEIIPVDGDICVASEREKYSGKAVFYGDSYKDRPCGLGSNVYDATYIKHWQIYTEANVSFAFFFKTCVFIFFYIFP